MLKGPGADVRVKGYGKARICVVTPDLVGVVRNGGIGTACTELVRTLAAAGHAVTVFFTQIGALNSGHSALNRVKEQFSCWGVALTIAEETATDAAIAPIFPEHEQLRMSRLAHEWLNRQQFDLVLFMDWQGNGFYSLSARRAGLAHRQHGAMVVICHSPTLWSDLGNSARQRNPVDSLTYFIERRSIEMADAAVSPSYYLLDWMRGRGYRLPEHALVQPNLLQVGISVPKEQHPEEVVFFGRLEYRKGIVQFCAAIDCLIARGEAPPRVVFLGKMSFVGHEHAAVYLARRTRNWPMPVEIVNRLGQAEAIGFLAERRGLAVVPSVEENSPYTVYECLLAGIPVIARDVGGIAELYAPEYRETHLFGDNPGELADRITAGLSRRLEPAALSFRPAENARGWTEALPALALRLVEERRTRMADPPDNKLVSVCLVHFRRPRLLKQALGSLSAQSYRDIEVILVDDGSNEPETDELLQQLERPFRDRGWQIIRVNNGYVGRARNVAARHARGDYLLFMDDDNVAKPKMVEALFTAAAISGADVVTSFASIFEGPDEPGSSTPVIETYMPVGGALGFALAGNAISDTNALVKRSVFDELGGFSEDYGLGHEDFEFFLRAVLRGKDVLVVPEALYWYRRQAASMISATPHAANRARSFRPFLEHLGPDMAELLLVAHGMAEVGQPADGAHKPERSDGDLAVLAQRDPDAWQSIDAAASIIAAGGATDLAKQLLLQLPDDTPGADLRRLRASAMDAAGTGDVKLLNEVFERARQIGETTLSDFISLTARIAWGRRQPFAVDLLRYWARLDAEILEPRLLLVEALEENGRTGEAFGIFVDALRVADGIYRRARPDIDSAVSRGDFEMGLVHYERHGRYENAPWPKARTFEKLADQLYRSLGDRRLAGPPNFASSIRLGFAAFAPGRKINIMVQEQAEALQENG